MCSSDLVELGSGEEIPHPAHTNRGLRIRVTERSTDGTAGLIDGERAMAHVMEAFHQPYIESLRSARGPAADDLKTIERPHWADRRVSYRVWLQGLA